MTRRIMTTILAAGGLLLATGGTAQAATMDVVILGQNVFTGVVCKGVALTPIEGEGSIRMVLNENTNASGLHETVNFTILDPLKYMDSAGQIYTVTGKANQNIDYTLAGVFVGGKVSFNLGINKPNGTTLGSYNGKTDPLTTDDYPLPMAGTC